jgi:hypothetical protein
VQRPKSNNTKMMTQKITLRTIQASEFSSPQGELITNAILFAPELIDRRSLRFGFAPNLRVPRKTSAVINGIVKRIEEEKHLHIDSPIKLSCRHSKVTNGGKLIEVTIDPDQDGVMDGGHRCKAFELAATKGLDLSKVTVQVQFFAGLNSHERREKALHANISRSVSSRSRHFFSGAFDELIEKIDMSKYPACFWRDGEEPDGHGILCQGLHVISILSWLNIKMYDRHGSWTSSPHSRAKSIGLGNEKNTLSLKDTFNLAHLFDDAFKMEKETILRLLKDEDFTTLSQITPRSRFSSYPSMLLDGTEIDVRLPGAIAGPVIFPARKMLDRENQWQYPTNTWLMKWVSCAASAYIREIKMITGKANISIGQSIQISPLIWQKMDAHFGRFRDKHNLPDKF